MVNYFLRKNGISRDKKKFTAQIFNSRSYTFDDIANYLIEMNAGLSSSMIYGMWEGMKNAVSHFLKEGGSINTELFNVHPSIKGVFEDMNDEFNSSRHQFKLNLQPGILLKSIPGSLKGRKRLPGSACVIISVTDIKSGKMDELLSPGANMRIIGKNLRIEGSDPLCGLYFVPVDSAQKPVKVEMLELATNKPSEIVTVIPQLKKGRWNLHMISQYSRGKILRKVPYKISFDKEFKVS